MDCSYWDPKYNMLGWRKPSYPPKPPQQCDQKPGTVLRIYIPAGAVVNIANIFEVSSPTGVCLIFRIPFVGGRPKFDVNSVIQAVQSVGGTVEFEH